MQWSYQKNGKEKIFVCPPFWLQDVHLKFFWVKLCHVCFGHKPQTRYCKYGGDPKRI